MKFSSIIARAVTETFVIRTFSKQMKAALLMCTLLVPVAAPIPAWAYALDLPPIPKDMTVGGAAIGSPKSEAPRSWGAESLRLLGRSLLALGIGAGNDKPTGKTDERKAKDDSTGAPVPNIPKPGEDVIEATVTENFSPKDAAPHALQTAQPVTQSSEQETNESTYEPENNLGSPPNKTEVDSPNLSVATKIKHRAGIANYSFQVPFASLPGRGIDTAVGMVYNSRVWNATGEEGAGNFEFNVDKNWLAPGFTVGYGKLKSHFWSYQVRNTLGQVKNYNEVVPEGFTDPDGTRHQLECKTRSAIPGTQAGYTYCAEYGTMDGSFVKVLYQGTRFLTDYTMTDMSAYASTYFTLVHTDGSKVVYSVPGAQFSSEDFYRDHYPVLIQDTNGNRIDIAYKDGKDNIDYVRDTLGRQIKFYYESGDAKKLIAVTVPGYNGGAERQTIRFYYEENVSLNSQGRFSGYITAPTTIRTLKYVYFPGNQGGYRYDYHSNFGMITKITKLTGMAVSEPTSVTSTGTVTSEGTSAATTEYLYPNDGSSTALSDAPKFTQRTDDWLGRTALSAPVTYYDAPEPATGADRVSKTTVKQSDFDVEYKTIASNTTDWQNGLTKETSVTKLYGPSRQYAALMMKTAYSWKEGMPDISGRKTPVLEKVEVTDDAGQVRAQSFDYDAYNNQKIVREHDFATAGVLGTELRRTETTYETGSGWINNQLLRLPKEVKTIVSNATVSKVVCDYDDYSASPLVDTPNVLQYTDPGTTFRGNVTRVTSFANAATDSDASVAIMNYDVTGNVIKSTANGVVTLAEYAPSNQYAYVTKVTKGSVTQLVSQSEYDPGTGLVVNTTDENNRQTRFDYDPSSLRQTRIDLPNGAWSSTEYYDAQYPYYVKSSQSLDAARSLSSWSYVDGAGHTLRTRSQTANGFISTDTEFDSLGRSIRSFNPIQLEASVRHDLQE